MKTTIAKLCFGLMLGEATAMYYGRQSLARQEDQRTWRNPDGGNVEMGFGNQKISMGSIPFEQVLFSINDRCSGLTCDQSWTLDGEAVRGNDGSLLSGYTIRVSTDASISSNVNILDVTSAFDAMIRSAALQEGRRRRGCDDPCQNPNTCPSGCRGGFRDIDEFILPDRFAWRKTDETQLSFVNFFLEVEKTDGLGACDIILGTGAAVAGAVNGVAGGIFSVAALLCEALG